MRSVLKVGRRLPGSRMVVFVSPGTAAKPAFVVGRRVGHAVDRNRARRVLREAWRGLAPEVTQEGRVVVVARPGIRGAKTQELESEMRELLARGGLIQR